MSSHWMQALSEDCHVSLNILVVACKASIITHARSKKTGTMVCSIWSQNHKEPWLPTRDTDLVCWFETYVECKIIGLCGIEADKPGEQSVAGNQASKAETKTNKCKIYPDTPTFWSRKAERWTFTFHNPYIVLYIRASCGALVHAECDQRPPHTHRQSISMWASVKSEDVRLYLLCCWIIFGLH